MSNFLYIDPIERIEKLLRALIHEVLTAEQGADWTTLYPEIHKQIVDKRDREAKKTKSYDIPIAYTEFSHLGALLKKNQILFAPIFEDFDKYYQFYKAVKELRNPVKHHREIKPHQEDLLKGIAGEFEDVITKWRIGYPIEIDRTEYQFMELIQITEKSDDEVLADVLHPFCQARFKLEQ